MNVVAKLNYDEVGLRHPAEAVHMLSLLAGSGQSLDDATGLNQPYPRNLAGGRTSVATNASSSTRFRYSGLYNIPEEFRDRTGQGLEDNDDQDVGMEDASGSRDASQMSLGEILAQTHRLQGRFY